MRRTQFSGLPVRLVLAGSLPLGPACGDPARDELPPDGSAPACEEGLVLDGDTCVPAECGVGTWGGLPTDGDAVYVDAGAAEGGDGSAAAPLRGLREGVDAAVARGATVVRVAAGTYDGNLQLDRSHADLEIAGRCSALVRVDGAGADPTPVVVEVDAAGEALTLKGLTLTGGPEGGMLVWNGAVRLEATRIEGNHVVGLVAVGRGAGIEAEGLSVQGTASAPDGSWGRGAHVEGGASLVLRDSALVGNREMGVYVGGSGSEARLEGVGILDTSPSDAEELGVGMFVVDGARLDASDVTLSGNHELGLYLGAAEMVLTDCVLSDTQARRDGERGLGAWIDGGGSLRLERCAVSSNRAIGVFLGGSGTEVTLVDSVIEDTREVEGDAEGLGAWVESGAHLRMEGGELRDNTAVGLYLQDEGTTASLSGVAVRGTRATQGGAFGRAVEAYRGASLSAEDLVLEDNHHGGLHVSGPGTTATLAGCAITATEPDAETFGAGIGVSDGARLVAGDCGISGMRGAGLLAYGAGTTVELASVSVTGTVEVAGLPNAARGVEVADGAALTMVGGELDRNQGVALLVSGEGASARLEDSVIRASVQYGDGRGGRGLGVESGAAVSASGLLLAENQSIGVFASGAGTSLELSDSVIEGTRPADDDSLAFGLFAQVGAYVSAWDVEVRDNEGPGLYAVSEGTVLLCEGCALRGNQFAGAVVAEAGGLELFGVTVEGTLAHGSEGGGVGVFSMSHYGFRPSLRLWDSTVGSHPYAAVWLTTPGTYEVVGNDLTGGPGQDPYDWIHLHGDAVYATGGIAPWEEGGEGGLLLAENTLRASGGAGVFLDAASATLRDNTAVDNATDLVQQRCDGVRPVPESELAGLAILELCPEENRPSADLEFALVLMEAEAED